MRDTPLRGARARPRCRGGSSTRPSPSAVRLLQLAPHGDLWTASGDRSAANNRRRERSSRTRRRGGPGAARRPRGAHLEPAWCPSGPSSLASACSTGPGSSTGSAHPLRPAPARVIAGRPPSAPPPSVPRSRARATTTFAACGPPRRSASGGWACGTGAGRSGCTWWAGGACAPTSPPRTLLPARSASCRPRPSSSAPRVPAR
jgi:hypothetical protein